MRWIFLMSCMIWMITEGFSNGAFFSTAKSGELITEPYALKHCRIMDERLLIDMSAVERGGRCLVVAEYEIMVDTPADSLLFLFVASSLVRGDLVMELDGKPLDFEVSRSNELIIDWKKPYFTTPWGQASGYGDAPQYFDQKYLQCTVGRISRGNHKLTVRYQASATESTLYLSESETKVHSLSYALYPARLWKSFGGLFLEVRYPKGWELESNVDRVEGQDGVSVVRFSALPNDYIHVHTRYPTVTAQAWRTGYEVGVFLLLLVFCLYVIRWVLKVRKWYFQLILLLPLALVATIGYFFFFLNKDEFIGNIISSEIVFPNDREYLILASPLFFMIGLIILIALFFVVKLYNRRRST